MTMHRHRHKLVRNGGAIVAATLSLALLGGCAKGSSAAGSGAGSTNKPAKPVDYQLRAGRLAVESAGPAAELDASTTAAALTAVQGYVRHALQEPLATGKAARDLETVFDDSVLARLQPGHHDRAVLTDDGVGRGARVEMFSAAPVDLIGLAERDGRIDLVSATILITERVDLPGNGAVTMRRLGSLDLQRRQAGGFAVTGYDLVVRRTGSGVTGATASASTAAPS